MSTAAAEYLGESWTFIDCPGSVELDRRHATRSWSVTSPWSWPSPWVDKALTLAPLFKFLDDNQIPHILFINKMDQAEHTVREILAALQGVSSRPLVLRQVPIRVPGKDGDDVTGYVDLISERAYKYRPGQESDLIKMPEEVLPREQEARTAMLEKLADFDDHLMEELLSDAVPSKEEIYQQAQQGSGRRSDRAGHARRRGEGCRRASLLKALRHDAPGPEVAAKRSG